MNQDILAKVESILKEYPQTRDNDSVLAFIFYRDTLPAFYVEEDDKDYQAMDVVQFFKKLSNNQITAMASIQRARRKIQETFEELRGEKWKKRHRNQKVVVNTIGKWEGKRRHEINLKYHNTKLS